MRRGLTKDKKLHTDFKREGLMHAIHHSMSTEAADLSTLNSGERRKIYRTSLCWAVSGNSTDGRDVQPFRRVCKRELSLLTAAVHVMSIRITCRNGFEGICQREAIGSTANYGIIGHGPLTGSVSRGEWLMHFTQMHASVSNLESPTKAQSAPTSIPESAESTIQTLLFSNKPLAAFLDETRI